MKTKTYFNDWKTAWAFANMLPKTRYTVTDYGKDDSGYFIEYIDRPAYTR